MSRVNQRKLSRLSRPTAQDPIQRQIEAVGFNALIEESGGSVAASKLNVLLKRPPIQLRGTVKFSYFPVAASALPDFQRSAPDSTGELNDFTVSLNHDSPRFAVRYSAHIDVAAAGDFTFNLTADNLARLSIEGQPVIDKPTRYTEQVYATVALPPGLHKINLDYLHDGGERTLNLDWFVDLP